MNKITAAFYAAVLLLIASDASAADVPHAQAPLLHQMLPQLYVGADIAQKACPTDKVVWVNWSARISHLSDDKFYGHTVTGAYACAEVAAAAGIKPAH